MPTHLGSDKHGNYAQWGNQKKYYYKTERGKRLAITKANKQGEAIEISTYQYIRKPRHT